MLTWMGSKLNVEAQLASRLLWDQASWSIASAIGIFFALRTGLVYIALAAAGLSLWSWISSYKHYRAIADIPTVRLSSAPQGHVEIVGTGDSIPEYPNFSPLTSLPCLWYDYKVEHGTGQNKSILQQGTSHLPFALVDNQARVMVIPEGAQIISKHRQSWQRGDETCTESVILQGDALYVLGEFINNHVHSNSQSLDKQASTLLHEWKNDQHALRNRFDADGNGIVDMHEWEYARKQAQHDILTGKALPENRAIQCIRKPQFGGLFIISNYSAQQLAHRFQRWSWLHLGIFFAALLVAVWR